METEETWKDSITRQMEKHGEVWGDMVATTLTPDQLTKRFYHGFGGHEGCPFTLWTRKRVYFPIVYDGAEWAGSAPRSPCDEAVEHMGGE